MIVPVFIVRGNKKVQGRKRGFLFTIILLKRIMRYGIRSVNKNHGTKDK